MANKTLEMPKWAGRQILEDGHAQELDQHAATLEFDHKLSRGQAEQEAHGQYTKEQHAKAAAHHLMSMKAAQGAGSMDEARKHGVLYGLHLKALGEDPYGPVPAKVKSHVDSPDREHVYKFKPHKADSFLLGDEEAKSSELSKNEVDERLETLRKAVDFAIALLSID